MLSLFVCFEQNSSLLLRDPSFASWKHHFLIFFQLNSICCWSPSHYLSRENITFFFSVFSSSFPFFLFSLFFSILFFSLWCSFIFVSLFLEDNLVFFSRAVCVTFLFLSAWLALFLYLSLSPFFSSSFLSHLSLSLFSFFSRSSYFFVILLLSPFPTCSLFLSLNLLIYLSLYLTLFSLFICLSIHPSISLFSIFL